MVYVHLKFGLVTFSSRDVLGHAWGTLRVYDRFSTRLAVVKVNRLADPTRDASLVSLYT